MQMFFKSIRAYKGSKLSISTPGLKPWMPPAAAGVPWICWHCGPGARGDQGAKRHVAGARTRLVVFLFVGL